MAANEPGDIDGSTVDFGVLAEWMDQGDLPAGPIQDIRRLGGGTQNVLVGFTRGGERYVLRRGPEHLRPKSNEVMRREMRVLAALAGTDVPHPTFVAGCLDESVMNGATFYLMRPVDGFNATVDIPEPHRSSPEIRHQMGLEAADAIAKLGAVDHKAVGLDDFGHPDGFLERQVPRWQAELASYNDFDGYPGPDIAGVDDVGAWLEKHRPSSWQPGIMHGDYHLANVMYALDGPQLVAIVDWEMCTIGDPLLDLGWLLATWSDDTADAATASLVAGPLGAAGGLPTRAELVARYVANSDRNLDNIAWYTVLACYKLGIVLEGTHARAFAGKAPKGTGDMLHMITLGLFARATEIIRQVDNAGGDPPWPSTTP